MQGVWWILTIPKDKWEVPAVLHNDIRYLKGQGERGEGGYEHWQLVVNFKSKKRLNAVKTLFCPEAHCELSRSAAACDYVWKEDTRIEGTQFELGTLPFKRNDSKDWARILTCAKEGNLKEVEETYPDVVIRNYSTLNKIMVENSVPQWRNGVTVHVYWGASGTGKTHRAFEEAGELAEVYIKNPNTKWWDGYRGQKKVIIDEFTGRIDISYLLGWLEHFPINVEIKGSQRPLCATEFWITSNLKPEDWYQEIKDEQRRALRRRLTQVVEFINYLN